MSRPSYKDAKGEVRDIPWILNSIKRRQVSSSLGKGDLATSAFLAYATRALNSFDPPHSDRSYFLSFVFQGTHLQGTFERALSYPDPCQGGRRQSASV